MSDYFVMVVVLALALVWAAVSAVVLLGVVLPLLALGAFCARVGRP